MSYLKSGQSVGDMSLVKSDVWLRSKDGIIAGVCKGIADRLEVDPWLVRAIWLASVLFFGVGAAFYIVLAIGLTREDLVEESLNNRIMGVCVRISKSSGVEVGLVRVLTLISAGVSFGVVILVYLILHFFMPWPNESKVLSPGHPTR